MTTEQEICRAIREHRRIIYTYDRPDRAQGRREGNPHIVFYTKNGHLLVHMWKIGGVSTDPHAPLPDWRSYYLDNLTVVEIQEVRFDVESTFKPDSNRYHDIVCRA